MNDAFDPLERELAALQPRPLSPELRQAVAGRLAAEPLRTRRRFQRVVLAGAAIAACLALALGVWLSIRPRESGAGPIAVPDLPWPRKQHLPETWRDYQRTLITSEPLDEAFPGAPRAGRRDQEPVAAFGRADHVILMLEGDAR